MKRARLLALLFCASIGGCRNIHVVDRESIDGERFFLVALKDNGEVRSISAIYETAGNEQALLDVDSDTSEVYVVGLSHVRLRASDPRYDESRAAEVSISIAAPPETARLILREDDAFVQLALPKDAQVLGARGAPEASDGARENLDRGLTVELPIILDTCAEDHPTRLVPFGATAELLAGVADEEAKHILKVAGAEDRALLVTKKALYYVERGGSIDPRVLTSTVSPYTESPAIVASALGEGTIFASIAAYYRPVGGERQFLVAGQNSDGGAGVWRMAIGTHGVRLVEAVYVDPPQISSIKDIMVDGQDIAVAVGENGLVITSEVVGRSFVRVETPRGAEGNLRRTAASHILTQPHAFATEDAQMFVGYAFVGYWDRVSLPAQVLAIAASTDGDDLWVAGEHGMVVRRMGSTYETIDLEYPPSLSLCGVRDPATGRIMIEDRFNGGAMIGSFVYLQPSGCTSMMRIRRADRCVSAIEDDGPARAIDARRSVLGSWDDVVLTGGPFGLLLEVER